MGVGVGVGVYVCGCPGRWARRMFSDVIKKIRIYLFLNPIGLFFITSLNVFDGALLFLY